MPEGQRTKLEAELEGAEVLTLRDEGVPPLRSKFLKAAALLFGQGVRPMTAKAFLDATEEVGGEPQRTVTVSLNNADKVTFRPIPKPESLSPGECVERMFDYEWMEKNANHPLAFAGAMILQLRLLEFRFAGDRESFKELVKEATGAPPPREIMGDEFKLKRHLVVRNGKRRAYLPADLSEEEAEAELKKLKFYE